jgi:hypothetical protein
MLVGDDRNQSIGERQEHRFADQVGESVIVWVHGDTGVAQHGFRTGRRDSDEPARKL